MVEVSTWVYFGKLDNDNNMVNVKLVLTYDGVDGGFIEAFDSKGRYYTTPDIKQNHISTRSCKNVSISDIFNHVFTLSSLNKLNFTYSKYNDENKIILYRENYISSAFAHLCETINENHIVDSVMSIVQENKDIERLDKEIANKDIELNALKLLRNNMVYKLESEITKI
jgi:hypothetical protein